MIGHCRFLIVTAIAAVSATTAAHAADVVERRGTADRLEGVIERLDPAGVSIRAGAVHFVPWHEVRDVQLSKHDPAVPLAQYLKDAQTLWRARTRLERGDAAMAEPLFERMFANLKGQSHETALVAAEGLLRCRLARGANDAAVIAALETARMRRAQVATEAFRNLPAVVDDGTGLCPILPPAWAVSQALLKLERDLAAYDAQGDAVIAAIARSYHSAARSQLGMSGVESLRGAAQHPGVVLITALAELESSDEPRRGAAREALQAMTPALPEWAQAWAHFAIGKSMLAGADSVQDGLVRLAHLPAMHGRSQPYLTGMALARMAEALEKSGDVAAAAALREELARDFPGHPALAGQNVDMKPASTTSL